MTKDKLTEVLGYCLYRARFSPKIERKISENVFEMACANHIPWAKVREQEKGMFHFSNEVWWEAQDLYEQFAHGDEIVERIMQL
jgi:hypothetical protein